MAAEPPDELLQACLTAPRHGLNAKALILQAALAADGDSDTDGSSSPSSTQAAAGGGPRGAKRQRQQGVPRAGWAGPGLASTTRVLYCAAPLGLARFG